MTLNFVNDLKNNKIKTKFFFKRKIVLFIAILAALSGLYIYSCIKDYSSLLQFRTTLSSYNWWIVSSPDRSGLETLNMSGSGVLQENAMLNSFKTIPVPSDKIHVINLTSVNRLYANGRAFRWFHWRKSPTGIQELYLPIKDLKFKSLIHLNDNAKYFLRRHYYPRPENCTVETEEQMVNRMGYQYASFYVNRREVFPLETIDNFIEYVGNLPQGSWVHFHCDGGNSRTTTMMIFYDILKNGKHIPLSTIIERQHALGGVDVNDIKVRSGGTWKLQNLILRKDLVEDFYRFVNDPKGYGVTKWSEWFKAHGRAQTPTAPEPA